MLNGSQCKNWSSGATIINSTFILGYFRVRNSFLPPVLKSNHEINIKSKMSALNLHNREGNCGTLCRSCSCSSMIIIIINMCFGMIWIISGDKLKNITTIYVIPPPPVHPPFCVLAQFYIDERLHSTFKLAINCAWKSLAISFLFHIMHNNSFPFHLQSNKIALFQRWCFTCQVIWTCQVMHAQKFETFAKLFACYIDLFPVPIEHERIRCAGVG